MSFGHCTTLFGPPKYIKKVCGEQDYMYSAAENKTYIVLTLQFLVVESGLLGFGIRNPFTQHEKRNLSERNGGVKLA